MEFYTGFTPHTRHHGEWLVTTADRGRCKQQLCRISIPKDGIERPFPGLQMPEIGTGQCSRDGGDPGGRNAAARFAGFMGRKGAEFADQCQKLSKLQLH